MDEEDREVRPAGPARWWRRGAGRAKRSRLQLAQAAIAVTILIAGLAAGILVAGEQREDARAGQDRAAERAARALREEVEQAMVLTRAARGVMEATASPDDVDFARFAEIARQDSHLLALTWMPRVPAAGRAAWERRTGRPVTRYAGIARPPRLGPRTVYFPVAAIAPRSRWTDMLLGLDPGTIPGLAATLAEARDGAEAAMAPPVQLAGTEVLGLTLFAPVYRAGAATGDVAERREALRGYVAASYQLADIVGEAFEALPPGARMQIRDAGEALEGSSAGHLEDPSREAVGVGGRRLEVLVSAGGGRSPVPALLAALGGALVAGLVALMFARLNAAAMADAAAGDALRASEGRLRHERDYAESLLEAMQDGLVMLAPDGRISEVSRGFCELTGFGRAELLGASAPYPYWPEATAEGVARGFARLREAGSYEWDLPFLTRDGRPIAVILRASVLRDAAGDTVGYLATVKDVTERRRAEDQLRHQVGIVSAVLDTAPDAILMVDRDGRTVISNPAADRLSSIAPGLAGADADPAAELTTDPAGYRAAAALLAADADLTTTQEFELVASGRIFRRYSAPVRADGADAIVGRLFITDEVTDERRADRAKDEFIQLASHELRTPLTSILGYLELLEDEEEAGAGLTPEQHRFVEVVHRNAERLLMLVGDLLVVARADAGRLGVEIGTVDLEELVLEAVEAQRLVAEERGIALSAEAAPLLLAGDRGRLGEVIDNLLSNALKFTPPGGRVFVRAGRDGSGGVAIEVADTGMGIPASEQQHLFERFYRTRAALSAAIPGTGLGLTISKTIVEAHGGRIGVESEEGRGTTFRIWLPPSAAEAPAPMAPPLG